MARLPALPAPVPAAGGEDSLPALGCGRGCAIAPGFTAGGAAGTCCPWEMGQLSPGQRWAAASLSSRDAATGGTWGQSRAGTAEPGHSHQRRHRQAFWARPDVASTFLPMLPSLPWDSAWLSHKRFVPGCAGRCLLLMLERGL